MKPNALSNFFGDKSILGHWLVVVLLIILQNIGTGFLRANTILLPQKVVGDIKDPEKCTDGLISKDNYSEFIHSGAQNKYIILYLDKTRNVKSISVWFPENAAPDQASAEFSDDYFSWRKAASPQKVTQSSNGLKKIVLDTSGSVAVYIKLDFLSLDTRLIRISEVQILEDNGLTINEVKLSPVEVADHSVSLKMTSDIDCLALVQYGEKLDQRQDSPWVINFDRQHIIKVDGLLKGTEYVFLGIGRDCNENMKYSLPIKVKTSGVPLPRILSQSVLNIFSDHFTIKTRGNVRTKIQLWISDSTANLKEYPSSIFLTNHSISVAGLQPETTYYYKMQMTDEAGNVVESKPSEIKTFQENISSTAKISGDFNFIGENLNPVYDEKAMSRLSDNDYSYLKGSVMSGVIFNSDQTLNFEFPSLIRIAYMDLVWWQLMYSKDVSVNVSTDGQHWEMVANHVDISKDYSLSLPGDSPYVITHILINKEIRFVKFLFTRGHYYSRFPQYMNLRLLEIITVPNHDNKSAVIAVKIDK